MQKIDTRFIDALPKATPGMLPKPFPGRYPTRVWVSFANGQVYLGKPLVKLVDALHKELKYYRSFELIEFDRGAKFFGYTQGHTIGCMEYYALYHPNVPLSIDPVTLLRWFGMPFRTLRAGKHAFYTTFDKQSDKTLIAQITARLNPQKPAEPAMQPKTPRPKKEDYLSYEKLLSALINGAQRTKSFSLRANSESLKSLTSRHKSLRRIGKCPNTPILNLSSSRHWLVELSHSASVSRYLRN